MSDTGKLNTTRTRYPRKAKTKRIHGTSRTTITQINKETLGTIDPFKPGDDWTAFAERLEVYFDANSIKRSKKVSVLLLSVSVDVYQILKNLCHPQLPKAKSYNDLANLLSEQFQPKSSVYRRRVLFDSLKQGAESINEWYTKIAYMAAQCEFGTSQEARVADKFIAGMRPGPILDRLCEEDMSKESRYLLDLAIKQEAKANGTVKNEHRACLTEKKYITSSIRRKVIGDKLCCCYSEELDTPGNLNYTFYQNNNGYVRFKVRTSNNAQIALTTTSAESDPMYEVFIGGWRNTKSVIRKNRTKPDKVEVLTPNILNANEFRTFWVCWNDNTISAGYENNPQPFIRWTDDEHVPIHYVGVCTDLGARGSWIVHQEGTPLTNLKHIGESNKWVASSGGNIPSGGFVGGEDRGSRLYVIRCNHKGNLLPGKYHSGYKTAYVPWNGVELEFDQYEMLCNCNGRWIRCFGANIPPNAISGGNNEDGEPLYIGRAYHEGTLAVGKVHKSHRCCYIPYGGLEFHYQKYEILVS